VTKALVLLAVLALANAAIGALGSYVLDRTAESVVLDARRRLVSHLVWLRIPAVDRSEPGDLMARVTADTTLLREVTTGSLVSAVTNTLMLLATITVMAWLDPLLLVVTIVVLGGAQVVTGVVVPRISRAAAGAQESVGAMGTALERVLGAMRTVKASGAEQREAQRVDQAATQAWQAGVRAAKWEALAGNTAGLAIQLSFIVVLGLGAPRSPRAPSTSAPWSRSCSTCTTCCRRCRGWSGRPASTRSARPQSPASATPSNSRSNPPAPQPSSSRPEPRPPRSPSTRCASATAPSSPRPTAASASPFHPVA
jgi:ABC-type multidrug transport system fused ATPase/permease subunit